ncbi:retrovirus-related Pol polyprotein from transposon TNT 1-94 [Trichonephila clavipes]|nr:retrovirus-related Pol polyprotein from transposon TNT 1-94 [Trichonephila clavipes]
MSRLKPSAGLNSFRIPSADLRAPLALTDRNLYQKIWLNPASRALLGPSWPLGARPKRPTSTGQPPLVWNSYELSDKAFGYSSDYTTWSTDVRFLLPEKNCFEIVAGKESAPENKEENRRELSDFNTRQRLALSILYLNISTEYRSIIENVTDPAEAWKLLRDNFRPDNRSYHIQPFNELFRCKIQPNEKLNIFTSRMKRISDQLEAMGKPMEDGLEENPMLSIIEKHAIKI